MGSVTYGVVVESFHDEVDDLWTYGGTWTWYGVGKMSDDVPENGSSGDGSHA